MGTAITAAKRGGPNTPEGKAIVSKNAIRHGLLSKETVLPTENARAFRELRRRMIGELSPATPIESIFCERIIVDIWRLRRALCVERDYALLTKLWAESDIERRKAEGRPMNGGEQGLRLEGITNALTDDASARIRRYLSTIDRSMLRSLHELQRLQAMRKGENVPIPVVLDVNVDQFNSEEG